MVNRRVGKSSRFAHKKKMKFSNRLLKCGDANASTLADEGPAAPAAKLTSRGAAGKASKKALSTSTKVKKNLSLEKQRSQLLKQQAAERMVLKHHVRELKQRRANIRKGEDAKTERRELGKYIRQLEGEQKKKHEVELQRVVADLKKGAKKAAMAGSEGIAGREEVSETDLRDMFAHLTS